MNIPSAAINAGLWIVDSEGRTECVNERLTAMLGFGPQDLDGAAFTTVVHDASREAALEYLRQCRNGRGAQTELQLRRKDGTALWAILAAGALSEEPGSQGKLLLFVVTDISERKRSEDALSKSEARYRVVAETAQDQIFVIK